MSKKQSHSDTPSPNTAVATPWWRRFIQPPVSIAELGEQRRAQLLLGLSLIFFFTTLMGTFFAVTKYALIVLAAVSLLAVGISRTRYYQIGSAFIITAMTILTIIRTTTNVDAPLFFLPLTFVLASALLPFRSAAVAILVNIFALFILPQFSSGTYADQTQTIGTLSVVGLLFIFTTAYRNNLENDRLEKLRKTNQELDALRTNLDSQVQARTAELALAAEVGHHLSQVRELDTLLEEASERIWQRFNLYNVQIYLTDDKQQTLFLRAGAGEVARKLLSRRHSLAIGPGSINGLAAAEKQTIIVEDTTQSPISRLNPLLPETCSEMSVPLLVGQDVVGVLNLHSKQAHGLTRANVPAFEALAGQLAAALVSARLFTEAMAARAEVEAQTRHLTGEAWQNYLDGIQRREFVGYAYENQQAAPLTQPEEVVTEGSVVIPIAIGGETIGSIQLDLDMEGSTLSETEREIVSTVAQLVGQRMESLRLLAEAQQYRFEAEKAMQRLTHEGWSAYQENQSFSGFVYDGTEVKQLATEHLDDTTSDHIVSLPLQVQGETFGELILDGVAETEAQALVATVAEQLSSHVDNLRLSEQTEQALAGTEILYRGSERIVRADTFEDVLSALIDSTYFKQFDRHNIMLFDQPWDDQQPEFAFVAALQRNDGQPPQIPVGTQFELDQFPTAKWFSRDEPALFSDVTSDERADENFKTVMAALKTRGLAIFPLVVGGHWIGVVMAQSDAPISWNGGQVRQAISLVDQAATVIQTIRLLQETRQRAEREALVNSITQKIQQTVTMESALETAVQELGQALQTRYTTVQLSTVSEKEANGTAETR